jgi:hypothetical protein
MTASIGICDVIARIESSGNPYAYRFEPTVFDSLRSGAMISAHAEIVNRIMKIHSCNLSSAQVIYSSSYGLFQLMGFNIWGQCEYDRDFSCYLHSGCMSDIVDISLQQQKVCFARLLTRMGLTYSVDELANLPQARKRFALTYNGSTAYESAIVAALQSFKIPVAF